MSLWKEVGDTLVSEIDQGVLPPGARLPTDYDLAARFGVHRHTIRRALSELQQKGLIRSERGRGTFVVDDFVAVRLGAQSHFEENLLRSNRIPRRTILALATIPSPQDVAEALKIAVGRPVFLVRFLGEADTVPIQVVRMYFDTGRYPDIAGLLQVFQSGENVDLPTVLEKAGLSAYRRKTIRIRCRLPVADECHLLRISANNPIFETDILNIDSSDNPAFFATTSFCGGRVELTMEL